MINTTVDLSNENYGNILYTLISSLGISLALIYIFQYIPKISLLSYIGKNTIIYLLVHVPILRTLQFYFPIIEHSRLYATVTAVCLYFSILILCWIINRFFPVSDSVSKEKGSAVNMRVIMKLATCVLQGIYFFFKLLPVKNQIVMISRQSDKPPS